MIAVQFFHRADIERKLAPYRCRMIETLPDGTEIWLTGWDYPFTLTPETGLGEVRYDSWQLQTVIATVIALTMPKDFDISLNATGEPFERARPKLVPKSDG